MLDSLQQVQKENCNNVLTILLLRSVTWQTWNDPHSIRINNDSESVYSKVTISKSFKSDFGNQTRNQLEKVSSNAKIKYQQRQGKQQSGTLWIAVASNARVANCNSQMDFWEIKNRYAIARKLSSKWPTDPSDWQGAPKYIRVFNNEFL